MSIFSKGPTSDKSSSMLPALIILAILIICGGVYAYTHKKNAKAENSDKAAEVVLKPSGLDTSDKVSNVGDVEKVIAKWVESNPEAIVQAVINMQQKAAKQQMQEAQKSIGDKSSDIFNHKGDPVIAPKNNNVTVVEFFDYNCGYCKKAQATIDQLLDEDKKVKIIFKEYPILGPSSEELTKVSLAVNMVDSNLYIKFHNALMKSNAKNRDDAFKIAASVGVNVDRLKKVLETNKGDIDSIIAFNRELGGSIGVNGTPAFIVGEELISGAVDISVLKEKIEANRKSKK